MRLHALVLRDRARSMIDWSNYTYTLVKENFTIHPLAYNLLNPLS